MLSILIPCYNYNCFPLAEELHEQCMKCNIDFEILCIDDGSLTHHNEFNEKINKLKNGSFRVLPKNIGRSAIRNFLAKEAKHNLLLFFDSDTWPNSENFILNILQKQDNAKVIYGGVVSNNSILPKKQQLRWVYRKKRECPTIKERKNNPYYSFSSASFTIKKNVFVSNKFNESLTQYGCEDLLFAHNLKEKNISIKHINNPIFHKNTEETSKFLTKTKQALENLKVLTSKSLLPKNIYRVTIIHQRLKKIGLNRFAANCFKLLEPFLRKKLNNKNPKLFLYDLYRLGYFCSLDKN